jgi:phosphotriesterase-related protein
VRGRVKLRLYDREDSIGVILSLRGNAFPRMGNHDEHRGGRRQQLEIVLKEKTAPAKFVWVHADREKDHACHKKIAESGAWVEFDHIGPAQQAIDWHLECVRFMEKNNLLGRTLISQDAGYFKPGEPNGGSFKDYTHLYLKFAPQLTVDNQKTLLWENPRTAFGN